MVDNAQKVPLARSLEAFGLRKAQSAIDLLGQSLPASVVAVPSSGIVKVKVELTNLPFTIPQITVPIFGAEYLRLPIQVGMKGAVMAFDYYLGGMTGLGGGTADLTPRPNLSNLVFAPLGSTAWSVVEDPNAVVLYGPNGAILRDAQGRIKLFLQPAKAELDLPGGVPFVINGNVVVNGNLGLSGNIVAADGSSTYAGNLHTSGNVVAGFGGADQVGLQSHTHTQPNDSHNDVEGPTSAPTAGT
jgi:hypothetical protein